MCDEYLVTFVGLTARGLVGEEHTTRAWFVVGFVVVARTRTSRKQCVSTLPSFSLKVFSVAYGRGAPA